MTCSGMEIVDDCMGGAIEEVEEESESESDHDDSFFITTEGGNTEGKMIIL